MEKRLACFVLILMLSGCLGQAPAPPQSETPAPITQLPTTIPPAKLPSTTVPPPTAPPTTAPPSPLKDYKAITNDLEKNFPKLASELKELPELNGNPSDTDLEAINDIYYLWKNATNPEVKEAFDLMIKGGTPDQKDFGYEVPKYNTELWGLFQLAEDNEFKQDDTTALAIAMVDGLYRTMGDEEVRRQVRIDDNAMLNYAGEISEWCRQNGLSWDLEKYPLEAKVAWAWRGNFSALTGRIQHIPRHVEYKIDKWAYNFSTLDPSRMKEKKDIINRVFGGFQNIKDLNNRLEYYFYFSPDKHWQYTYVDQEILIDGVKVLNDGKGNADFDFNHWQEKGFVFGDCGDETALIDGISKAFGIATIPVTYYVTYDNIWYSHFYTAYFNQENSRWTAAPYQLSTRGFTPPLYDSNVPVIYNIVQPPVVQTNFVIDWSKDGLWYFDENYKGNAVFKIFGETPQSWEKRMTVGIPTSQFKGYLLYEIS